MGNIIKKNIWAIALSFVIAIFFVVITNSLAFAYSLDEWRPSVEISKELDSLNTQKASLDTSYNEASDFIYRYETNANNYDENIEICQKEFDDIQYFADQKQSEIEQLTKSSYSAYFAKLLMDNVVGYSFITNYMFHWDIVNMIASSQDKEILSLLEDYYTAKINLENAISDKNNTEQKYANSKQIVLDYNNQIPAIDQRIEYLNLMLDQVIGLEFQNGKPGESRIEGNGKFCNPCPGSTIVSYVGEQRDGYVHKGVDMAISAGSPIYCADDGVVTETGENGSMGKYVKVLHSGNLLTIYMHCSVVFVPNNVKVNKGDNIALVGSTGDSTGPHLHFQTEKNGEIVNGLDYIN